MTNDIGERKERAMATATSVEIGSLIYRRTEIHDGRPSITGTAISVQNIALLHREGLSAEEIAKEKPLSLHLVYAALAYYYANKDEIEASIREDIEEYDRLEAEWRKARAEGRA